VGNPVGIETR